MKPLKRKVVKRVLSELPKETVVIIEWMDAFGVDRWGPLDLAGGCKVTSVGFFDRHEDGYVVISRSVNPEGVGWQFAIPDGWIISIAYLNNEGRLS